MEAVDSTPITNVAAYRFSSMPELRPLRAELLAFCKARGLKGTILLSPEGINLFVAGAREGIEDLMEHLRAIPGLEALEGKYSESDHQPFRRMLVRLKKEIISFGVEGIEPGRHTSPKLPPAKLARWIEEGRPMLLLDTRNDYEVELGTFAGATTLNIQSFRQFPEAVRQLPAESRDLPVVMFCTGGIRCEKAGPFMEQQGFSQVFQLEGGILKYFEECGGAHYEGECFVFDQRVGLDPGLRETDSAVCYVCQKTLTAEDQADPRYRPGQACPACYQSKTEKQATQLRARREALRKALTPLPGSVPYENERPIQVPGEHGGRTLGAFLTSVFSHEPRERWETLCREGRLVDSRREPVTLERVVQEGERFLRLLPGTIEPDVSTDVEFLHEDEALIVVNKPAPLPMHPGGRFNRNTLASFLQSIYHPQKPRNCHRLDANTTGLALFARTRHYASKVQTQFAQGEVAKVYAVRISGHPTEDCFVSEMPVQEGPGPAGSRNVDSVQGLPARTEFEVRARCGDGTALLEARPVTGRTNQIRVHLWHLGYPVMGDPTYLPGGELGETATLPIDAPPMALHAWRIALRHPVTGKRVEFEAPLPEWWRSV